MEGRDVWAQMQDSGYFWNLALLWTLYTQMGGKKLATGINWEMMRWNVIWKLGNLGLMIKGGGEVKLQGIQRSYFSNFFLLSKPFFLQIFLLFPENSYLFLLFCFWLIMRYVVNVKMSRFLEPLTWNTFQRPVFLVNCCSRGLVSQPKICLYFHSILIYQRCWSMNKSFWYQGL